MKKLAIYGSGGFAREVALLVEDINEVHPEWELAGYLDDDHEKWGQELNGLPVLGDHTWVRNQAEDIYIAIGIGSPNAKEAIRAKLEGLPNVYFPNLVHPGTRLASTNTIGKGTIICAGNILTCNISLGDFVTINLNCTIGHDTVIESCSTILPNASISGNVHFEKGVDFGTNATIIQGVRVGAGTIVGAGAVVVKDLPARCTAVGMPAKPIKYHEAAKASI